MKLKLSQTDELINYLKEKIKLSNLIIYGKDDNQFFGQKHVGQKIPSSPKEKQSNNKSSKNIFTFIEIHSEQ